MQNSETWGNLFDDAYDSWYTILPYLWCASHKDMFTSLAPSLFNLLASQIWLYFRTFQLASCFLLKCCAILFVSFLF